MTGAPSAKTIGGRVIVIVDDNWGSVQGLLTPNRER
jgi:hypothetical protein